MEKEDEAEAMVTRHGDDDDDGDRKRTPLLLLLLLLRMMVMFPLLRLAEDEKTDLAALGRGQEAARVSGATRKRRSIGKRKRRRVSEVEDGRDRVDEASSSHLARKLRSASLLLACIFQTVRTFNSSIKVMTQTVRIPLVSKDVEDLLLWRSVPKSGAALAAIATAYFVLEWSGLSVLAIAANGALLTVAVAFVWNNVAGFIGK